MAEGNTGHTEVSAGLGAGGQLPVTRFPPIPVPPQIVGPREPHIQVSVVQDEEATLECNATGKPLPRVTWERDGQPVGAEPGLWLQDQGRSLHVERAQATHAGRYSCVAENVAGRAERRFELSVLGEDQQPAGGGQEGGQTGGGKAASVPRLGSQGHPWFCPESGLWWGLLLGEAANTALEIRTASK